MQFPPSPLQHRRDVEITRWGQLSEQVAKVERSLEAEIVRRAEADKALVMKMDAELKVRSLLPA